MKCADVFAMSAVELRKLRDSTADTEKWYLYNACIRLKEAMQRNKPLEIAAWEHIVKELFKNSGDM